MIFEAEYKKQTSLSHRKKFAQFFTPEPIAKTMVNWILDTPNFHSMLEPAFGLGIFSRLILKRKRNITITAFDVDEKILNIAKNNFNNQRNINFFLEDYLFNDWNQKYDTVICNPPYFKFHDYENKKSLKEINEILKINLSGFTNIYSLFLLKSIYQLNEDGRAAFIVPSEFLNSDYGKIVKDYLIKSKSLRHIIIFDSKKNIFDDALTTSAIILLEKNFKSSKVSFSNIKTLSQLEQYPDVPIVEFETTQLDSKIKWRAYYKKQESINFIDLIPFSSVAKVVRGIATGSNEYFVFNKSKAKKYNIPNECLLPCITRSKDIKLSFFFNEDLDVLKNADANIFLLDARKCQTDNNIKKYIEIGEKKEINKKYLTSKRSPWFSLENREPSPIWVGVFNRNGLKFIRNEANVLNLTTFHCIYHNAKLFNSFNIDLLFAYLLTDVAKKIFNDNRREYGDGLRKFEPNDLNNALMLDLSKLDKAAESKIINLYYDFRETVIIKKPVLGYVEEINSILVTKYKA